MSTKSKEANGLSIGVEVKKSTKSKKSNVAKSQVAIPAPITPEAMQIAMSDVGAMPPEVLASGTEAKSEIVPPVTLETPIENTPPVIIPAAIQTGSEILNPVRDTAIMGLDTGRDFLVTTGNTWNSKFAEVQKTIVNKDPKTFPFARFEYIAEKFPNSKYSIIRCSDTKHEIGVPFTNSYQGLEMDNSGLMNFIEILQAGIEKEGLKLTIETAGTLKDRNQQFVSFKINGMDEIEAGGRKIRSFLSILKGLDKLTSFTFVNSTITVCCANTFAMVNDDTGAPLYGKVKFTKNCALKIAEVPLIVRSFVSGNESLLKRLNSWHNIGMTPVQAESIFAAWLGDNELPMSTRLANIVQRLKALHIGGKGNKGETALDAFNAVTEYYTHESAGETKDPMKQFESSEIGDGAKSKGEFFDFLVKSLVSSDMFTAVCKVGQNILIATANDSKAKDTARQLKAAARAARS